MAFTIPTETLSKFGVPVDGVRNGILTPKRKNLFSVSLIGFGSGNNTTVLTQQVSKCTIPKPSFDEIAVHAFNSTAYYPGKAKLSTFSITLRDDITNSVKALVEYQLQKQFNYLEQTTWNAGSIGIKFNCLIEQLDGTNNSSPTDGWYIEGCFLTDVGFSDLDYSTSDMQEIELTVRPDNFQALNGLFVDAPVIGGGVTV